MQDDLEELPGSWETLLRITHYRLRDTKAFPDRREAQMIVVIVWREEGKVWFEFGKLCYLGNLQTDGHDWTAIDQMFSLYSSLFFSFLAYSYAKNIPLTVRQAIVQCLFRHVTRRALSQSIERRIDRSTHLHILWLVAEDVFASIVNLFSPTAKFFETTSAAGRRNRAAFDLDE